VVICVDLDGPFPSFNILSPILHWIHSDLQACSPLTTLTTKAPFIANYIGPGPPPGSSPHRYVFLLYIQPNGFNHMLYAPANGAEYGNMARMRFDLARFEQKAKLGNPIAVNYFKSN
jgi:phosphatidylethanolamine-binding protein